jgi:hypothetical protein
VESLIIEHIILQISASFDRTPNRPWTDGTDLYGNHHDHLEEHLDLVLHLASRSSFRIQVRDGFRPRFLALKRSLLRDE